MMELTHRVALDGRRTYEQLFYDPSAPGVPSSSRPCGGVCDQTVDYGRNTRSPGPSLRSVTSIGTTTNPASARMDWLVIAGVTQNDE